MGHDTAETDRDSQIFGGGKRSTSANHDLRRPYSLAFWDTPAGAMEQTCDSTQSLFLVIVCLTRPIERAKKEKDFWWGSALRGILYGSTDFAHSGKVEVRGQAK